MDILKLHITNFLTIGEAELDLDNRGLLLIQGKNLDDTSACSNGAGKSSIVDALCWAIYGTTARDASGDEIVCDKVKKDTFVGLDIDDGGQKYRIERYRKHSKHKDQLFAWQVDATGTLLPLHKGTARETQDVIEKIMGCSLDVFKGSIYAGQEQMPDLPGMTDKQLKLLVEEAAGVEELAEAHAVAQKDCLVAEKALVVAAANLSNLHTQHDQAVKDRDEINDSFGTFNTTRKDRARTELAKVTPLLAELTSWQTNVACFDEPSLAKRKGEIEALLAGLKGEQDELDRLQKVLGRANTSEAVAISNLRNEKNQHERAKTNLANIDSRVGTPCEECGKPFTEHDMAALHTHHAKSVGDAANNLRLAITAVQTVRAEVAAGKKAVDDHKSMMTDATVVSAELKVVNDRLTQLALAQSKVESLKKDVEGVKAAAKLKLTEENPHKDALLKASGRAGILDDKIDDAEKDLAKRQDEFDLLADAVKVFGPAGVRAHILDTVTPFLNAQTGEYLGTLADGNIHATWSTLSTTAKGELKEKFNIAVTNDKGGKAFKLQSGGEKRKVRLSTALALQDMVASRASKPINLFMADEIDDALDTPGLERLMTVLDKKARERGTVLVISHNALTDWIDSVITVVKSGGRSTVSGDNLRTF